MNPPLLSAALDMLPLGVLLMGGDGSVAYANDEACKLLFLPEEDWGDVVGQQWQSIMAQASLTAGGEESCTELRAAAARGQRSTRTLECVGAGSSKRWLQVTVSPLASSPGTCMAILEDVTSSRSSEELQQLLMSGIACAQLGISIVEVYPGQLARAGSTSSATHGADRAEHQDVGAAAGTANAPITGSKHEQLPLAGRILYVNPALERMVGRSLASLQGRPLADVLGPCPSSDDCDALSAALASRQFAQVTVLASRECSSAWTRISITPISQLPFSSMAAFPSASWLPNLASSSGLTSPSPHHGHIDGGLHSFSRSDSGEQEMNSTGGAGSSAEQSPGPLPLSACDSVVLAMARLAGMGSISGAAPGLLGLPEGTAFSSGLGDDEGLALGLPMHCLCVHQDVSARMSEQLGMRLRDHALSSCSEGIAIADANQPDQPLVYVNDAFLQITGYTREEVLGRNCRFLQGPNTSREAIATLRAAIRSHQKVTLELLNYKRNGEEFWNRLSVTPVFDDAGALVSYIGVQSDVTELMRRKEEERRLLEAKVAAETATEAKSMFLANMSHEIRTPLNGMMATAQLLLVSALTPEQRDLAETILESGNSLLSILGDILDFCKLDHGAMELQHEPVHMRHSVEACIELVAPEAQRKGLAISYSIDEEAAGAPLLADPIRLRQVLANLLSNAVKFTERGEVAVEVRVEDGDPQEANGNASTFSVASLSASSTLAGGCEGGVGAGGAEQRGVCHQGPLTVGDGVKASGSSSTLDTSMHSDESHGVPLSTRAGSSITLGSSNGSDTGSQLGSAPPSAPASCAGWSGTQGPSSHALTASAPRAVPDWPGLVGQADRISGAEQQEPHSAPPSIRCAHLLGAEDGDAASSGACSPTHYMRHSLDQPHAGCEDGGRCTSGLPASRARSDVSVGPSEVPDYAEELQGSSVGAPCTESMVHRPPRRVHIVVRDTGIGIGPDMMCQLFQGFRQGHEAMSRRYGGTGLGLAISRRLSELMGGSVWVESSGERGKGSSFHVVIPAVPVDASSSTHGFGAALGAQPFFSLLSHDEHLVLRGRRVVVDLAHDGTAAQVCQSCGTLGMVAVRGDASDSFLLRDCEIAVIGVERAKVALKAGWKGRPVVAVGARDVLTPTLQPLVVMVGLPVAHARLANALVKSTVLLKWAQPTVSAFSAASAGAGAGPKVSAQPISPVQLAELRSWRAPQEQRRHGHLGSGAAPSSLAHQHSLGHLGLGNLSPVSTVARGGSGSSSTASSLYLGGQLAVTQAVSCVSSGAQDPTSPASTVGVQRRGYVCMSSYRSYNGLGDGFGPTGVHGDGEGGGGMDMSSAQAMLLRRSSLDNSSLDRARVMAAMANPPRHTPTSNKGTLPTAAGSPDAPASTTSPHTSPQKARPPPMPMGPPSRRSLHLPHAHVLPACIPEHTELLEEDAPSQGMTSVPHASQHMGTGYGGSTASGAETAVPAAAAAAARTSAFAFASATAGAATSMVAPAPFLGRVPPKFGAARVSESLPPAGSAQQAASTQAGLAQALQPPLRILIAEDNKVNQKVVLKVLAQIAGGCVPDVVENGLQVLAALQKKSYDLILMDIHMPEMDGLEATRRIVASYPPASRPRIIALSADTLQALHDRCREAGIEEFIVKPFRVEDLKRVMQHCRRVAPEPAAAAPEQPTAVTTAAAAPAGVPAAQAAGVAPAGEHRSSSTGTVRAA